MIYCRCSIHKHIVQNESTRGKTKIILLTLEMARQEVSRTTHIEEGELRVTHENAILTNITKMILKCSLRTGVNLRTDSEEAKK